MKSVCCVLVLCLIYATICLAQVPQTISYQGILKNVDGTIVENGTYQCLFTLYNTATGGTALWTEQQSAQLTDGVFNVLLGSITPINLPFDTQYYLGITIGGQTELSPRIQLSSSPYSFTASHSLNASQVVDGSIMSKSIASGQVVKSINGITDNITLGAGSNITITKSGSTLTLASASAGGLTLPFSESISSSNTAFDIMNTGSGKAGVFWIINSNNDNSALMLGTNGKGCTLSSGTSGTSAAGYFGIQNPNNSIFSLSCTTDGSGTALYATNDGTGEVGYFLTNNSMSEKSTIVSYNKGKRYAGFFVIDNANNSNPAIYATTNGSGPAGFFYGSGNSSEGIWVSVPTGNSGLYVSGGTKNAVVATSQGARELYTEESTEVWFSDYGFGKLSNGIAEIHIDPLFVETVSLDEPYHVFVQPYGNAELYVSNRTQTSFKVNLRDGEDNIEFSYRITAKRKGYEHTRLEHAPRADNDPNLYPEKRAAFKVARDKFSADRERYNLELEK